MAVPSPLTLGASKTSRGLPLLAGGGRQHRSKVPRVLPEHRGPYAVVISRGLFRCRRSAFGFSAPRGCHTSTLLMSNVWQRCGLINRRFHVCLLSSAEARRHPSEEYMLHAWLVDQLVAEPIKVTQMTAKHNRVPAAFRSSTGRRPEGLCHSIFSSIASRLFADDKKAGLT